jgi:hypothetical protein
VQRHAIRDGTVLGCENTQMLNVFVAGQEMVQWDLTALGREGPFRLGVYHSRGAIVEYFGNVPAALQRQRELEDLFTSGRAPYEPVAMAAGE